MDATEAKTCHDILSAKNGEPDPRSWGEQYLELTRVLRKGTAQEKAARLHGLYRVVAPLPGTHELMVERFEMSLLTEMAKPMKSSLVKLRSTLHRGQPAFGSEAPYRELSPIPRFAPEGWGQAGGFHVFSGKLSLSEAPVAEESDGCLVRPAHDGVWVVLHRPGRATHGSETHAITEWVAVHHARAHDLDALLARVAPLGEAFVHGGTTAAVDVEVADDPWYRRDFENGEPKDRGFIVGLGGDGTASWSGTLEGQKLVLVRTESDLTLT